MTWRPSAANGTRAVITTGIQRVGTRNAGVTSQRTREGAQMLGPEDRDRTRRGEHEPRQDDSRESDGCGPLLQGQRGAATPRDDEPDERECDREKAEVVPRLRRVDPCWRSAQNDSSEPPTTRLPRDGTTSSIARSPY